MCYFTEDGEDYGEQVYDVSSEDSDTNSDSACQNETLSVQIGTMQFRAGNTSSLQKTGEYFTGSICYNLYQNVIVYVNMVF